MKKIFITLIKELTHNNYKKSKKTQVIVNFLKLYIIK